MSSSRNKDIRAADEYQAPSWGRQNPPRVPEDAEEISTSPFFSDKESAEAMRWARSQEVASEETAVDDEPLSPDEYEPGGIKIGRKRRDSQVGSYDEHGSIFDGPSAGVVPSSVSR
jgi:cation-transporting ATPase 13A2